MSQNWLVYSGGIVYGVPHKEGNSIETTWWCLKFNLNHGQMVPSSLCCPLSLVHHPLTYLFILCLQKYDPSMGRRRRVETPVDEEAIRRAKCEDVEVEYSPSWDADTVILDREEGKRKRAMWGGRRCAKRGEL